MGVELRHLRYFVAVAEECHFTRAAKRLRIAQPALSRQIRDLEEELGCTLLDRRTRNLALTASGEALLKEARKLLGETERLKEVTQRAANGQTGSIAVGYVSWIAPKFFFPLFRNLRQKYPGLEIDLKEMAPLDQIQALVNDRLHLGFGNSLSPMHLQGFKADPFANTRCGRFSLRATRKFPRSGQSRSARSRVSHLYLSAFPNSRVISSGYKMSVSKRGLHQR
jgi:DNA-binding transcriptional LysR family regulator